MLADQQKATADKNINCRLRQCGARLLRDLKKRMACNACAHSSKKMLEAHSMAQGVTADG